MMPLCNEHQLNMKKKNNYTVLRFKEWGRENEKNILYV